MASNRSMFYIPEDRREDFSDAALGIIKRFHDGKPQAGDPKDGDGASGLAWLQKHYVEIITEGVTGVPIHFQTMATPHLVLPPYLLLQEPLPPPGYAMPEFYCQQCSQPGGHKAPVSRAFFMKRLCDYTLTHCGG